jgi:hypothetical protein
MPLPGSDGSAVTSLCTANNQIRAKPRKNLSNRVQISGVSGDQWLVGFDQPFFDNQLETQFFLWLI